MNQFPKWREISGFFAGLRAVFCCALCMQGCVYAGEIKLVDVSSNPHFDFAIIRDYSVSAQDVLPVELSFTAKKFAPLEGRPEWWLDVRCFGTMQHPTDQPLPKSHDALYGKTGLVYQCVDQLIADVPDAEITEITVPLQIDDKMWSDLRKKILPIYKRHKRQEEVVTRKPKGIEYAIYKYLNESPEVGGIARRIASKLHRRVKSITLGVEFVSLEHKYYFNKAPWSELIESPTLGLDMKTIPVGIEFASSEPAGKSRRR